jgi:hypothetical protein
VPAVTITLLTAPEPEVPDKVVAPVAVKVNDAVVAVPPLSLVTILANVSFPKFGKVTAGFEVEFTLAPQL